MGDPGRDLASHVPCFAAASHFALLVHNFSCDCAAAILAVALECARTTRTSVRTTHINRRSPFDSRLRLRHTREDLVDKKTRRCSFPFLFGLFPAAEPLLRLAQFNVASRDSVNDDNFRSPFGQCLANPPSVPIKRPPSCPEHHSSPQRHAETKRHPPIVSMRNSERPQPRPQKTDEAPPVGGPGRNIDENSEETDGPASGATG